MSPLRILVIVVLLYIGYRLITGGRKKSSRDEKSASAPRSKPDEPVQDVLVEDPICHSLVPKQQAIHLKHHGSMVYFCSEECCNIFVAQEGSEP